VTRYASIMDRLEANIGILGAGNMGGTILRGLLEAGVAEPSQLLASDPRAPRREAIAAETGVRVVSDNAEVARFGDVVILAVKPQACDRVLREVGPHLGGEKLLVSIAAGVTIRAIEAQIAEGTRVVRTMPNTPSLVATGATAIAPGPHATEHDVTTVCRLFDGLGITEVLDESQLDAVTGLSGSGPAFIFVIIEALADAGVKQGLHRSTAQRLAAQTVLGAAQLLIETGEHPGRLKDMVASPGGTTIAGLHTIEAGGLRTTLIDAVEVATQRSRELGAELESRLNLPPR